MVSGSLFEFCMLPDLANLLAWVCAILLSLFKGGNCVVVASGTNASNSGQGIKISALIELRTPGLEGLRGSITYSILLAYYRTSTSHLPCPEEKFWSQRESSSL